MNIFLLSFFFRDEPSNELTLEKEKSIEQLRIPHSSLPESYESKTIVATEEQELKQAH